jgi:hypothetical protein
MMDGYIRRSLEIRPEGWLLGDGRWSRAERLGVVSSFFVSFSFSGAACAEPQVGLGPDHMV